MLIAYVHGFLSGPNATKAHALEDYIKAHKLELDFWALDFPDTPREAYASLIEQIGEWKEKNPHESICLVGSSMGGFFSTLLSARFACKAALLNPCTHPQLYFKALCGDYVNPLTNRAFTLTDDMMPYLQSLDEATVIRPELLEVYLGGQDEVLDYRMSMLRYNNCPMRFYKDEDHAFTRNFGALIPHILDFAQSR